MPSAWLRQFLRRVPGEELAARGPTAWAAVAAGLLEFLQVRLPEASNVRVFNPTLAEHGWEASHTVVEIVTDDSPFLVDSVSIAIAAQGNLVHSVIHPVLVVDRDPGGHVLSIADDPAAAKGRPESVMHFEVDRRAEAGERVALREAVRGGRARRRARLRARLARDARSRARDRRRTRHPPDRADDAQRAGSAGVPALGAADHFTFLGYREYEVAHANGEDVLRAKSGSGLGVLRGADAPPRPLRTLAARQAQNKGAVDVVILTKTNARLDRASAGLHGLSLGAQVRARRQAGRRGKVPRIVSPPVPTGGARGTFPWCATSTRR